MVAAIETPCVLLKPIDREECERRIDDPAWAIQPKLDGVRFLIGKKNGAAYALNRTGIRVSIPDGIGIDIDSDHLIDGELVGAALYVFDILELGGKCLRGLPVSERHAILSSITGPGVTVVPLTTGTDKRAVYETSRDSGGEGVVFKRLGATYRAGRGGDYLKFKFYATASCVVSGANQKRSVRLRMGCGAEVGSVTIPASHDMPAAGAVVEVRYLYACPGGSLYQPSYLGVRNDVDSDSAESLKFKRYGVSFFTQSKGVTV